MHTVKVPVLVPKLREEIEILLDSLVRYKDSLMYTGFDVTEEGKKLNMVQNLIFEIEGLLSKFDKVEAEMLEHSNRV